MLGLNLRSLLRLVLIFVLLIAIPSGFAARKPIARKATTDAAGRTHVRPTPKISEAQRKAAAHLRLKMRAHSARPVHKTGGNQ